MIGAVAATGCGSDSGASSDSSFQESGPDAKAQVVKDLHAYYAALGAQDIPAVCTHVSTEFKKQAAKQTTNCKTLLGQMLSANDAQYRKKLQQVRAVKVAISGDRAEVTVTGGPLAGYTDLVHFIREDGTWKWTQASG